jgi:hypothetical protein
MDERSAELRRLGVSTPVVRLATGAIKLKVFPALYPPVIVYRGMDWPERGLLFVPLWEESERVTAAREKGGQVEFFAFLVANPSSRWRVAGSEQGLLATLFNSPMNECYDDPDEATVLRAKLAAAATILGFRYLAELDAVYAANYHKSFSALERACKRFVRSLEVTEDGEHRR